MTWYQVFGVGFLAGIGFTMSLFINSLAFQDQDVEAFSKIGILVGSLVAMIVGLIVLRFTLRQEAVRTEL